MKPQTPAQRIAITKKVVDSDLLTELEKMRYLIQHIRLEIAIYRISRMKTRIEKLRDRMNEELDVIKLRQDMVEL